MKYGIIALIVVAIDQISKVFVDYRFSAGDSLAVWEPYFYITYVLNPGAAFGLFQGYNQLLLLAGVLVAAIVYRYRTIIASKTPLVKLGVAIAVGGAVGNFIDRVRLGMVIDFLDFRFWPVFNVADIAIVVGVGILFLEVFRDNV